MKKTIVLVVFLALAGCAHWDQHYESQANMYVGQHYSKMYDEYGAPRAVAPLESGGHFIEFWSTKRGYLCEASVKTDRSGVVISIEVGGMNGCIINRY